MPTFTAAQLAEKLGGRVVGDTALILNGFAPADGAKPGDLTFAENESYYQRALHSSASAILVSENYPPGAKTMICVDNARVCPGVAAILS
jgi:UDP-3-O-[3-hydroxymyristoyl] glucosamine N-acyltransferase